ncbi:hypothetical protein TREPR_3085 [Treponema primitia ZAS-2]|uniref:Uncharacterized protein n=1 Tax=Treponema primitia (strain ATCC BAA-887 / DSM 12427 / ZAS-2) TaxID=545694 RepID=F5YMM3_TREPZ|nr:hypothetical protein TREPR_3085 [Treponema primitia ZAS-2]
MLSSLWRGLYAFVLPIFNNLKPDGPFCMELYISGFIPYNILQ